MQDAAIRFRAMPLVQLRRRLPFLLAFVFTGCFYVWTVTSNNLDHHFGEEQRDNYNLLVHGFLSGQLSLKADVPAELLRVANPYDPAQRPSGVALHDASLFHGHYYIYHGVVPSVLVLLPFRLITGVDLPVPFAVLAFALAGYGVALWILAAARERLFLQCGAITGFVIAVALGFATCAPLLLRRSNIYELPIVCASFFALVALASLFAALVRGSSAPWCVAIASLALGLAIGSRPTYVLVPFVFGAVVWWVAQNKAGARQAASSSVGGLAIAAIVPMATIGLLLAWYNFARFGSPTEFGVSYILSGVYEAKIDHFRLRYFPWNAWAYFGAVGEWGRYFPFFHPREITLPLPRQHYGIDFAFGLLSNVPLIWLSLVAFLRPRAACAGEYQGWRVFVFATLGLATAVTVLVLSFYAAMARYLGDFAPSFALVGAAGAFAFSEAAASWPGLWRRSARVAVFLLCFVTIFVGFAVSTTIYGRLRTFNPLVFHRIAQIVNRPVHLAESALGTPFGPIDLQVSFPEARHEGATEELISTGWAQQRDTVAVRYVDERRMVFTFEHRGASPIESEPVAVDRGEHRVTVAMGSLMPAETWPGYTSRRAVETVESTRRLRVLFDGNPIFDRPQQFWPASAATVLVGGDPLHRFSGHILAVNRQPMSVVSPPTSGAAFHATTEGAWSLAVEFPVGVAGRREPLIVTGETGRGDFIAVEYLAADRFRLIFDHWGSRGAASEPISYVPRRNYHVDIRHAVFSKAGQRGANTPSDLVVALDRQVVWREAVVLYGIAPDEAYVGYNPIGGSCDLLFSGRIAPR